MDRIKAWEHHVVKSASNFQELYGRNGMVEAGMQRLMENWKDHSRDF